jgi:hypothetical protein
MALIEHLMAMLWAIATVLALVGSTWALVANRACHWRAPLVQPALFRLCAGALGKN